MITLHLLRHGETIWHEGHRYAGASDVPLTERGRQQARALEAWGRSTPLAAIVSSDLSRAVMTARPLAEAAGLTPRIDARVREVDFGQGEGLTRDEMHERFPRELAAFTAHPAKHPLPGGEVGEVALQRALAGIVDLLQSVPEDSQVAVVSHGTVIRLLLCWMLGLPLDDYRERFPSVGNTALTTVEVPRAATPDDLKATGALLCYNSSAT